MYYELLVSFILNLSGPDLLDFFSLLSAWLEYTCRPDLLCACAVVYTDGSASIISAPESYNLALQLGRVLEGGGLADGFRALGILLPPPDFDAERFAAEWIRRTNEPQLHRLQ